MPMSFGSYGAGQARGFPTGMNVGTMGAQTAGMRGQQNPFWVQQTMAESAPSAWELASQILGGGAGGGAAGTDGAAAGGFGGGLGGAAQALSQMATGPHPGMSDPEYEQGLRSIGRGAQGERARLGSTMSAFSGSLDPESYMRASGAVGGREMEARGGLEAQRAGLDRQTLMQAVRALAPYFQSQQAQLGGLAGNIMRSGTYPI